MLWPVALCLASNLSIDSRGQGADGGAQGCLGYARKGGGRVSMRVQVATNTLPLLSL